MITPDPALTPRRSVHAVVAEELAEERVVEERRSLLRTTCVDEMLTTAPLVRAAICVKSGSEPLCAPPPAAGCASRTRRARVRATGRRGLRRGGVFGRLHASRDDETRGESQRQKKNEDGPASQHGLSLLPIKHYL